MYYSFSALPSISKFLNYCVFGSCSVTKRYCSGQLPLWQRVEWNWGRHKIKKSSFKIEWWLPISINILEHKKFPLDIFANFFLDTNIHWIIYFCCLTDGQSLHGSTEKQLRLDFSSLDFLVGWMSELSFHSFSSAEETSEISRKLERETDSTVKCKIIALFNEWDV